MMEALRTSILNSITAQLVLPALLLLVLLVAVGVMLWRAQKRDDFDLANMLRQSNMDGKESAAQLAILLAMSLSSWVLMSETLNNRLTADLWYGYLITWSGSPALLEIAKRWNGSLPFSKAPPNPPPTSPEGMQ